MAAFKIRCPDGLFSTGGAWPSFTNIGKAWSSRGALNCHLSQLDKRYLQIYLDKGCRVVEMVETEAGSMPMYDWLADKERRKLERQQKRESFQADSQLDLVEKTLSEIRTEFPELFA